MNKHLRSHRNLVFALLLCGAGSLAFGLNWRANAAAQSDQADQAGPASPDGVWQGVGARQAVGVKGLALAYRLNQDALTSLLNRAPREYTAPLNASAAVITLPLSDGTFGRFQLEESPTMEPALAAKYPDIKSYRGMGLDDHTATLRCDVSVLGFNALVLSAAGSVNIRPVALQDTAIYLAVPAEIEIGQSQCGVNPANANERAPVIAPDVAIGPTRKNYRAAIATTGEYTANYGGAAAALASVNTWLNGVNVIFERDIGAHFNLVGNNNLIIFTDAATDGLTNGNESTMLNEIVPILDANIGNANYDFGHVLGLHTTAGSSAGVASLAAVCSTTLKGKGATRMSGAAGNGSALGTLTHEFGHQFNANHSFNGTINSCNQKNNATSWESGSGNTLMSYNGLCITDNVVGGKGLRFHAGSYGEAQAWLAGGTGGSCGAPVATGNSAPTLNSGGNFTIPQRTPFTLTAIGGDPDAQDVPNLTYTWDQLNAGGATFPQNGTAASYNDGADANTTTRPIFRALIAPMASPARTFPSLTYILNNANVPPDLVNNLQSAEQLPRVDRTLNFRATVRDNRGGVNEADAVITVAPASGPFAVTAPNGGENLLGGAAANVTWSVAGTSSAPISTANVKISLSTDGGNTFPVVLAASTPNDGTQSVTVPNGLSSTTARVKIEAVGNIFFDISNANFTVTPNDGCLAVTSLNPPSVINTGGQVVLTGANFTGVTAVNFTGANVNCNSANCTVNSGTQITLTVPAGATTGPLTLVKAGCANLQTASLTICPNASTTLSYDGGFGGNSEGSSGYHVLRATPASYPATLSNVSIQFSTFQNIPQGAPFTVIATANPSGSTTFTNLSFQSLNTTIAALDQFVSYPITPITIASGDFIVGFIFSGSNAFFPGLHDGTPTPNRSYSSPDGSVFSAFPGDLLIRAVVFTGNCAGGAPACPTVNNINPTSGLVGSQVVITGTNFTGVTGVTFSNNVAATFTVDSATQITANVPAGAVTGAITISKTSCADVNTATFTVTAPPTCPTVGNIAPTNGAVGSQVIITGTNFTGVTGVKFSNNVTATFNIDSATQITATVPAGAITGPITISKTSCADVNTATFTVSAPPACPTVNNINPTNGQVGSNVVITGANFTGVTGVKFSNNVTATFNIDSATQITATVPNGAVTGPITISKTNCADVNTATFTVNCPTITITPPPLPAGTVNVAYNQTLTASGGTGPYNFTLTAGNAATNRFNATGPVNIPDNTPAGADLPVTVSGITSPITKVTVSLQIAHTFDQDLILQLIGPDATTVDLAVNRGPNAATTGYGNACNPDASRTTFDDAAATLIANGTPPFVGTFKPDQMLAAFIGKSGAAANGQWKLHVVDNAAADTGAINCVSVFITQTQPAPGLSLAANGTLSGTPTTAGTFNFTVKATDQNGCMGTQAYALTINPGGCPTITVSPANPALTAGTMGTPYTQTFTQAGGSGTIVWSNPGGGLPNGLTLNTGTGVLSGTPTAQGAFNFTIRATDANQCTGERAYSLVINPMQCPTITVSPSNATLTAGTVGTAYTQTFTQGGGAGTITWSVSAGTLPGGLTLNTGTGVLSGTPTTAATSTFTIRATDANQCNGERQYMLTINPAAGGNGLQFFPLPQPVRLLETRLGFTGCTTPGVPINANGTLTLPARTTCAGIPAAAAAVTGNITVVPSGPGYLTLFPSSATQPTVANSNFQTNEITNNVFTVGLGAGDGAFKIFSSATTHVIVDVTGYYAPPNTGGLYFHPLATPVRLLETRVGFTGCITPGVPLIGTGNQNADPNLDLLLQGRSPVAAPCNSIPATAQVLVGNATSVRPNGGGYLTIYPSGGTRPTVASSNYAGADVINGPFAVKLGADGKFKIYTFATTDLVVDILGYYSADVNDANGAGLLFNPLPSPVRLLETRAGFNGCTMTGAPIVGNLANATHTQMAANFCGLPAAAQAVVGNVSVVNTTGAGYLTLFPANLTTAPLVATSNYPTPAAVGYNRHFFVGLSPADGKFKVLTQFTTDLILDASGYFAP